MFSSLFIRTAFAVIALGTVCAPPRVDAAVMVHYLMIQGDFNSSLSGIETFKFRIQYDNALTPNLAAGEDLLAAVFGPIGTTPTVIDTKTFYSSINPINGNFGATYQYFSSFDAYIVSQFTVNGVTFPASPVFAGSDYWNYQAAGGSGLYYEDNYPFLDEDSNPAWTSSWDGIETRYLANGSFDGWTFGNGANSTEPENLPTTANYSNLNQLLFTTANGISVYGAAPEPTKTVLLVFGIMAVSLRRGRRKTQAS